MTESGVTQSTTSDPNPAPAGQIIAKRGFWYLLQRCIGIPVMCLAFGVAFLYDGFIRYPAMNQRIVDLANEADAAKARQDSIREALLLNERKQIEPHDEFGILIQKLLGFTLTPIGLLLGVYFFYRSRGEYRLAENVLQVPGHPPIPMSAISAIDMTRFDKKGIVTVEYEIQASNGQLIKRSLVIDDFVYDQEPTDQIIKQIEKSLSPASEPETPATLDQA